MASGQERSLQKRPDLVPERLMRGGLIVGVEQGIQGSLMSVTGAAIERITRERTEVPPQFKLPERPVYFLDPNTRRLIMISNRENRGENKTPDKYGLFAEIVELDEEGKPHYRLSSSEIILPNDNYHLVAVGPNNYGLPPSHIEVTEEEEGGKKKFVPWNLWLGTLQNWMNEVKINPNEDFDSFVRRFSELRARNMSEAKEKIKAVFPNGEQGLAEATMPINVILSSKDNELLLKASQQAGLYPVILDMKELAHIVDKDFPLDKELIADDRAIHSITRYLPTGYVDYNPAVITFDLNVYNELCQSAEGVGKNMYSRLRELFHGFQQYNSIFSLVMLMGEKPFEDTEVDKQFKESDEPRKIRHGLYRSSYFEEQYLGLLNKLKADLLLTMFLRGGAPIVK